MKKIVKVISILLVLVVLFVPLVSANVVHTFCLVQSIYFDGDVYYANVIDENGESWALEVDADCEVGQTLVTFYNDNNTATYDDDETVLTVSEFVYWHYMI